ncbi:MAG: TIGR00730 family Rossman fold protein [Saprospiraceae bacterium]|nr:TIGR00730 family Rossman fold protein [Saprospiraceae bacterium]
MSAKRILHADSQFLSGPNSRGKELLFIIKAFFQFIRGFRKLHFVGPCITVFGSARFNEDNKYYIQAREIGKIFAQMGFAVMTGGGPGIMEAANRGAYEVGGESIGCTIKLPKEQVNNPYMTRFVRFDYFLYEKYCSTKYSYGFIVMPGGFGTLDELFETLTLIQTGILHNFPVVIMGKEFYTDIHELIHKMIIEETISSEDHKLIKFTDDIQEATDHVRSFINKNYKVKYKASWILGEN